jgi:polysaccharide biosynthesis protein PslH
METHSGRRPTAGFIGNFDFHPNVDALQVLLDSWGPALVRNGWTVAVGGLASDRLQLPDWIVNLGPVDRVADFYGQIDVALAPIRLGGGMKVKVVEALTYGRPVIASQFAMDGFPSTLRDLVTIVEIDRPKMPLASLALHPPDPRHPHLVPFTEVGFTSEVRRILSLIPD